VQLAGQTLDGDVRIELAVARERKASAADLADNRKADINVKGIPLQ
jgi:hypothetical protein